MSKFDMTRVPVKGFDVRSNPSRSGLLLVQGRAAYELDGVAADVWRLCDGQASAGDIAKQIADEYGIELSAASDDVQAFLRQLDEAALLDD